MKTKKTVLNVITDIIPLIILSLLGIFKSKLFIQILGTEVSGLYQLCNTIMMYVALVDGGLSSALLYSLYKPNANGDNKKFNQLLSGGRKLFSLIGMITFTIAFFVSFVVFFFIKDCIFDYWYVVLVFLLSSLSSIVGYFFVPYNELLNVKEKKYIYNIVIQGGQIVLSALEIFMLIKGMKFEYILVMHSVIKLLSNIIEVIICRKMFPKVNMYEKKPDYSFKKMLPSLFFHKICGLVSNNIDTIILSSFIGLNSVAIYSAYFTIVNMMKNFLGKISSSITAIVGNSLIKEKERMYDLFLEINSMQFYMAIIVCVPLTLAINGFIDLFYEGEIQTTFFIAISFVLVLFSFVIKQGTVTFVSAGGLYKETKRCAILDSCINLSLSLTLINFIGIPGVLLGTAFSNFIAEYIYKTKIVYNNIFGKSCKSFFIHNAKYFIIYIIDLLMGIFILQQFTLNSIYIWFIFFVIFMLVNSFIILLVFQLMRETRFLRRFKILLKRG